MFVDLNWPLNASRRLSASAELLVCCMLAYVYLWCNLCTVWLCWICLQLGLDNPKINAMYVVRGKVEGNCFRRFIQFRSYQLLYWTMCFWEHCYLQNVQSTTCQYCNYSGNNFSFFHSAGVACHVALITTEFGTENIIWSLQGCGIRASKTMKILCLSNIFIS